MSHYVIFNANGAKVIAQSPLTRKTHTMVMPKLTKEAYLKWQEGALIQDAMPMLTDDEREFLLTGLPREEWDSIFGRGEGEDEE